MVISTSCLVMIMNSLLNVVHTVHTCYTNDQPAFSSSFRVLFLRVSPCVWFGLQKSRPFFGLNAQELYDLVRCIST